MMLADTQQQRSLERLRQAGKQPVAFADLHACGIDFPAAVVEDARIVVELRRRRPRVIDSQTVTASDT